MTPEQQKTQSAAPAFGQPRFGRPRFGRIDADLADVNSAIVRARDFLLGLQHPDGYWCGELEADSMLEADYIQLHTLLESGDPGRLRRAPHRDDALPERRRQLEHLSRRAGQHLALGQVLLLRQAHGNRGRRSPPRQVPRVGSRAWRRCRLQHLHQNVSLLDGPVRLRCRARHSAGDCPLSQLVLLQYLRNLIVVAVHHRSAGHHVRQKALQEDSAGAGNRRALRRRPRQLHSAPARRSQTSPLVAQLFPGCSTA